jgi:hypothetical protein
MCCSLHLNTPMYLVTGSISPLHITPNREKWSFTWTLWSIFEGQENLTSTATGSRSEVKISKDSSQSLGCGGRKYLLKLLKSI